MPIDDPRTMGKSLSGDLSGLWHYRIGDYRIIAKIEDQHFVVLVVHVGHRKKVYQSKTLIKICEQ